MSVMKNKSHRNILAITAFFSIIFLLFQLKSDWNIQPRTKDYLYLELIIVLLVEIIYLFKNFNK